MLLAAKYRNKITDLWKAHRSTDGPCYICPMKWKGRQLFGPCMIDLRTASEAAGGAGMTIVGARMFPPPPRIYECMQFSMLDRKSMQSVQTDPNQLTGIPMGLWEQKFLSLIYWKIEIKNTIISKFQISCVKIPCFHGEPENGHLADFGRRQRFLDLSLCTKMHSFTFGHKTLISCVIFIILAEILSLVGFRCI